MRPTRRLLEKTVLPAPGEGTTREQRENGYFTSRLLQSGQDGGRTVELVGTVKGNRDPGCGGTAMMLGESALARFLLGGSAIRRRGGG